MNDRQRLDEIASKVRDATPLDRDDGVFLYRHPDPLAIGALANEVRERMWGNDTFFNVNFHINATNVCWADCKFCSFARLREGMPEAYTMSLEQIRGKPDPCPQTDLYSLGIVLYEMLTGKVPFDADTPAEVLHQHLKTPAPRVSETIPTVPKPLDDLIDRLLQKRIEDRPASAVEVGLALVD